jgi:hypothetical protein
MFERPVILSIDKQSYFLRYGATGCTYQELRESYLSSIVQKKIIKVHEDLHYSICAVLRHIPLRILKHSDLIFEPLAIM